VNRHIPNIYISGSIVPLCCKEESFMYGQGLVISLKCYHT